MKERLIRRLLIANRGEIVCRIARTAQRLGITSLAVYSDADCNSRHVRSADEAYYLGGAAAADSYLDIAKVVALAKHAGADAVHPGYGFLAENAAFAESCTDAGLIFVGPPAAAIAAMGSKSASKAAMAASGVPVAPGYHGEEQSAQRLRKEAERVGFPLIIKASAGGGGKGMRVVHAMADMPAAIESAQRLAQTAFGDARLLLERYFPDARHVEVQIFADCHGDIVTLFDRDCSVQRRHQKIIEEAPAPGVRDEVRASMAQAAVTAARSVGYVGAGTVEFLLDEAQQFYFMEMNTRLQVEHPVTELITGIDLVEWQLRIAQGARVPLRQHDITQRGTAIEARVYAEDPGRGYMPSVGLIGHLHWPDPAVGLRVEAGVDAGDEVSSFYDPMLGKIAAWAETRLEAIARLRGALEQFEIVGVASNRALLMSVLADDEFQGGAVATDFLEVRQAQLSFAEPQASELDTMLAAIWCATVRTENDALWDDSRGWRLAAPPSSDWSFGGERVTIEASAPALYLARLPPHEIMLRVVARHSASLCFELNGRRETLFVVDWQKDLHLFRCGRHVVLRQALTEDALQASAVAEQGSLVTPLPGTVVAVHVRGGDKVLRGADLVTVEAMKMEHTLTAPYDGVVARVACAAADRVAAGATLVELTPLDP